MDAYYQLLMRAHGQETSARRFLCPVVVKQVPRDRTSWVRKDAVFWKNTALCGVDRCHKLRARQIRNPAYAVARANLQVVPASGSNESIKYRLRWWNPSDRGMHLYNTKVCGGDIPIYKIIRTGSSIMSMWQPASTRYSGA